MNHRTVRLRPLSLVEEGDEVLVGDTETGTFIAIPAVGGAVIAALQGGATVEQAAERAAEIAGEPVDVPAFIAVLEELGFLDDGERPLAATAPVQGRRWLHGLRPRLARPLFGRTAWVLYGAAALFCVVVLIAVPPLWPDPAHDAFAFAEMGLSALLFYPLWLTLVALHELWHWLAARSLNIPARFGVDRRMAFVVFETDLSLLWSVPRRLRYGPILAGLAIDFVVLAAVLACRLYADGKVLASITYILVFQMAFQLMVFLRTDIYAAMATWLGCKNLWRVKSLLLRQAFGRLRADGAAELKAADPRDVRVGRWFRWLWLAGLLVVAAWLGFFLLPALLVLLAWTGAELAAGPWTWTFWYAIVCTAPMIVPWLVAAALAARVHGAVLLPRFLPRSPRK